MLCPSARSCGGAEPWSGLESIWPLFTVIPCAVEMGRGGFTLSGAPSCPLQSVPQSCCLSDLCSRDLCFPLVWVAFCPAVASLPSTWAEGASPGRGGAALLRAMTVFGEGWRGGGARTSPLLPDLQLLSAGERYVSLPPSPGGAAEADPLFHHLHDLCSQTPQVPTAPLWQAEGNL